MGLASPLTTGPALCAVIVTAVTDLLLQIVGASPKSQR